MDSNFAQKMTPKKITKFKALLNRLAWRALELKKTREHEQPLPRAYRETPLFHANLDASVFKKLEYNSLK
jgi:hypothetical protein